MPQSKRRVNATLSFRELLERYRKLAAKKSRNQYLAKIKPLVFGKNEIPIHVRPPEDEIWKVGNGRL